MKHLFLLSSFLLLHFLACSQAKISDFIWKGKNNESFLIAKKDAALWKGTHVQIFDVKKYVKNNYFILSSKHVTGYLEQKYNIVRFTQDTLVLAPVEKDIFRLSQPDEENQYVFVNSLNGFTFVKLHFETSFEEASHDLYLKVTLDVDSTRKSRVIIHDDYMNETNIVATKMSKNDYIEFTRVLSACDFSTFSEEYFKAEENMKCCNSFFEIRYDDQIKKCKGCTLFPFYYPVLKEFLWNYIATQSYFSGRTPAIRY